MNTKKILFPLEPDNTLTPWLWIGTWSMGGEGFGPHNEQDALRVLQNADAHGLRHFDTAGLYAHGRSEELIRHVIRHRRREFFISSKGGLEWKGRRVEHKAHPSALREQLCKSLKRLHTDYLDLFQLHWPDPSVPVQESLDALRDFRQEGLIRYWGAGNLGPGEVSCFLSGGDRIPHQIHFNPIHNDRLGLQEGSEYCINCITSPLEQGLLGSGSSSEGKKNIGKRDIRNRNPFFSDIDVLTWNERLRKACEESGFSKVNAVLMWICSQPHVHAVIPGPRTLEQLGSIIDFINTTAQQNLTSSDNDPSILRPDAVQAYVPEDIWDILNNPPVSIK